MTGFGRDADCPAHIEWHKLLDGKEGRVGDRPQYPSNRELLSVPFRLMCDDHALTIVFKDDRIRIGRVTATRGYVLCREGSEC